jgi:hypothetical protein
MASAIDGLSSSKSTVTAADLAEQADRLLASDIVWSDLFQAPAGAVMRSEGVKGVEAPGSTFVENRQLVTETSMNGVIQRLKGASTGGKVTGLHGTNLVGTKALPANQALSTTGENTVTATTDLAFEVTIEDSGDSQEVGIKVTMTLQKDVGGKPIVMTKKISVINPGQQKSVKFTNINASGFFAVKSHLKIDVAPVQGEVKVDNNKASYPVIFSLP